MTTYEIAEVVGCCQATVWKRLHQFNIPVRERYKVPLAKRQLQELYWNQTLSTRRIGKLLSIPRSTIYRKLKEGNIPIRDIAESHISNKKPFSNSLVDKAYLIGFRIGDLNVTKNGPKSRTIQVKTGTTINAQVRLFESLFNAYCKVWKKKTEKGKINMQAGLDESFSFLLPKEEARGFSAMHKHFFLFLLGFQMLKEQSEFTTNGPSLRLEI
ncbi:hypothetical protein KJ972_03230 [Candidatus Micrarchaeota archaeon]|nr:hypothetical protein [Candidatus Micrarchaeota archaeon]